MERSEHPTVRDPLRDRFEAERPRATVERRQALADLENSLFGRPRRVVTVSRYVLLKRLAAGGGGVVYAAYDPELDRKVAIKLIRTRAGDADDSAEAAARLTREARAAAKLAHPNVVTVHDVGIYDPAELGVVGASAETLEHEIEKELPSTGVFVVMEHIEGESLSLWARRPHRWRDVLSMYLQAGEGLAAAHASGLVHRDFKPSNVMIGADGRARVLDFGLARVHGQAEPPRPVDGIPPAKLDQTLDRGAGVTREGAVLGTPAFMPPEQHAGRPADERSDQYSFCAALFESLHGRLPFAGDDMDALGRAKQAEELVGPPPDGVPAWVDRLLRRGLRADPALRHPSMRALLDALRRDPAAARLRLAIGGGLVAIVGGLIAALVAGRDGEPPCPDPAERLVGIWDQPTRTAIAAAFSATDKPWADATFTAVAASIDEYVERWSNARRSVCEATLVRRERSPELMAVQMQCLDARLSRLHELTRLLVTGDPQVVETAMDGVSVLAPLEACSDPALARSTALPPIAVRDRAAELDAELARGEALRRAGKLDEATATVDDALARAEPLEYPPLVARARLLRGQIRSAAKDGAGAEKDLREAVVLAEAAADDETATRALAELGFVQGFLHKRHAEASATLALARAKVERLPPDPLLRALVERNFGLVLLDERRFDEAIAPLEHSRALVEDSYGSDSIHLTTSLNSLGLLALSRGDFAAAIEHYERSLAILERTLGDRHPAAAGLLLNMGVIAMERGELARAQELQREGLQILRESVGEDHPYVAQALSNLAASLVGTGQVDEALRLQHEALTIKRARLAPGDPSIAASLNNLGAALNLAGRDEEALTHHLEALELRRAAFGDDHPETLMSRVNIGLSQLGLRRPTQARMGLATALTGLEAHLGPDSPKLVETLRGLGEAELDLGDRAAARLHLERAVALADDGGIDALQRADVDFALARLLQREDPDRAVRAARAAFDAYAPLGDANPRRQRIRAWLDGDG